MRSTHEATRGFAQGLWSERAEPIAPAPSRLQLEEVLKRLHDSEINAGLQTFFDGGMRVWIGDPLNGVVASAKVGMDDVAWIAAGSIARWLHEDEHKEDPPGDQRSSASRPKQAVATASELLGCVLWGD